MVAVSLHPDLFHSSLGSGFLVGSVDANNAACAKGEISRDADFGLAKQAQAAVPHQGAVS